MAKFVIEGISPPAMNGYVDGVVVELTSNERGIDFPTRGSTFCV